MNDIKRQDEQIRCAIYARSVTVNPASIVRQVAKCKQIAQEHGWAINDRYIYEDRGTGGLRTSGRPALAQFLAAVQAPTCPFNLLLVEDGSRLSRNLQRIIEIVDVLTALRVSVHAAETNVELSSSTGRRSLDRAALFERASSACFRSNFGENLGPNRVNR